MPKLSKNRTNVDKVVDGSRKYTVEEACALVKKAKFAKFDETVDLAVRLGVNPKHADQMVRGALVLPHGTGQTVRVLVFAKGEKEAEAKAAGADFAGSDDMVAKVSEGFMDFDRVIATPDMMGAVGKLGRILGPRGLMPNPKVGTVTPNVEEAVKNAKGGQVQYRADKAGIVQCTIGRASFPVEALAENLEALMGAINKAKPASTKGIYLKKVSVSSTMGVGVRVDQSTLQQQQQG